MTISLDACRRFILIGAALLVGVALALAVAVIPSVVADPHPSAMPEKAVPALWVAAGFRILVAIVLALIAMRTTGRSWLSTILLGLLALSVAFSGYLLTTAALAFRGHGPPMQTATILLFICSAADLLAAGLVAAAAFLLPRRT